MSVLYYIAGRVHTNCEVPFCKCEGEAVYLLRLGFWPLSPKSPTTAISVDLLCWLQYLTLEAQVSTKAFVSAMKAKEWGTIDQVCYYKFLRT